MIEDNMRWIEERRRKILALQQQKTKNDLIVREHLTNLQILEQQMATLSASIADSKTNKEKQIKESNQRKKVNYKKCRIPARCTKVA